MAPRKIVRIAAAFAVVAALSSACAAERGTLNRADAQRVAQSDSAIVHLLERVTFGPKQQDVSAVRRMAVDAYIDRQLHPDQIQDAMLEQRLSTFETLNLTAVDVAGDQMKARRALEELSSEKLLRAVYSERQLQEVLVDFWFNHFNVFAGKGADRVLVTEYERDTIRPHVFGKFRDLLGATAESPAMLFFLDNWMSVDPGGPHAVDAARPRARGVRPPSRVPRFGAPARLAAPAKQGAANLRNKRGLNENYARELMELHTLGVDGGYTQRDVVEVARCFTGWTIAQPREGGAFKFDERLHDEGQKVVLGHVIKAGGGKNDGDRVLDILARDPHTAHFIATKLVRRFVADDPPPALVERVAKRFRDTNGDLRETYRAILLSDEFWADKSYQAKAKSPFEFVASALRATNAEVSDARSSVQAIRVLGMPLYFCQPPTGYPDRAEAWMTSGAILDRMNFALALVDNRLPGVRVDGAVVSDTQETALTIGGPEFQKK